MFQEKFLMVGNTIYILASGRFLNVAQITLAVAREVFSKEEMSPLNVWSFPTSGGAYSADSHDGRVDSIRHHPHAVSHHREATLGLALGPLQENSQVRTFV